MPLRTVYFLALIFAALALVPTAAHLFELINKMRLGPAEYRTVQQIYRGWSLFGFVIFGALASTFALTVMLRRYPVAFRPALVALICIVGTQVIFWWFTFPVNQVTENWTVLPANWSELRVRWEYSHAAASCLNFTALAALVVSVLRYTPVR